MKEKHYATMVEIKDKCRAIADKLRPGAKVYGVPRGGIPPAYMIAGMVGGMVTSCIEDADAFIDDIVDSGVTRERFVGKYYKPFYSLYEKSDKWIVFPWEGDVEGSAGDICTRLLQFVGEDVNREGLKETPKRFLKAWAEWTSGYQKTPEDVLKVFEDGAEKVNEMVVVRDIPFYSQCEHHLAPFFGTVDIGYIPKGKIVGLSKFSRLVDVFARRLQVQERLTNQIADALNDVLKPQGVGVIVKARHLCMESRGVSKQGSSTTTSALRGVMLEGEARNEFLHLTK